MGNKIMPPLSLNEAARLFAVSPRTVSRLVDKGELSAIRIGSVLAVPFDGLPAALRHCFDATHPQALLTLHEVAARLECSPDDVRARTAGGRLRSVYVGRSQRWAATEIEQSARGEGRT